MREKMKINTFQPYFSDIGESYTNKNDYFILRFQKPGFKGTHLSYYGPSAVTNIRDTEVAALISRFAS